MPDQPIDGGQIACLMDKVAALRNSTPRPHWVAFLRCVLGLHGTVRRLFRWGTETFDKAGLRHFEQSTDYDRILRCLRELREGQAGDTDEPTRVITIRMPRSMHAILRTEAHEMGTSMNKLALSKLLRPIPVDLVPRERWARQSEDPTLDPTLPNGGSHDG